MVLIFIWGSNPFVICLFYFFTADCRRRPQTFLPSDPRGKKLVNRCAIINI
jgi:hypothetical protein